MLALSPNLSEVLQRVHGRWFPKVELLTASREHIRDYKEGMLQGAIGANTLVGATFTHSGLSGFTAARVTDGSISTNAWHVDTAVAGAWLKADLGVGVTKALQAMRVYVGSPHAGVWDVEYSDNDSTWTKAYTGFLGANAIGQGNWYAIAWPSVGAHRYWRLLLTNTPGAGAWYEEWQASDQFEFSNDGSVRLAASALADTSYASGTAKFTGLLDDLAQNTQRALLYEVDPTRNPLTVTKVSLRLHRKGDGVSAVFDGSFQLHTYVVQQNGPAEWNNSGVRTATNGWNIAPACSPVEVAASSVSWAADEADVDFVLPGGGIETGQMQQGVDRPIGKWHLLFILTLIRGTNTNAAWVHDTAQTDGEETTASKGTLSWWNVNRAVFSVQTPGSGMGYTGGGAYPGQAKPSVGGWFRIDKANSLGRAAVSVRSNIGTTQTLTYDNSLGAIARFDLGATPVGDVTFRGLGDVPLGTTLTFEVWNGSAWVAFVDGDRATIELPTVPKQQTYDMRVTVTGSADALRTPIFRSLGVTDVAILDVSRLIQPADTFYQVTDLVNCRSEVAELTLRIVRHGPGTDSDDTISELISRTANVTAMHARLSISAPGLARKDELHIDTYRVDDYLPSDAALDLICVSALDRLKLPVPKRKLVSGNWVVDPAKYDAAAGHPISAVFSDIRDGQLGLAARYAGSVPQGGPIDRSGVQWSKIQGQVGAPGVGTAGKTELAKDVLEQFCRIAGGVLTTIQGKIHYRDLFGDKVVQETFPEPELEWEATAPGLRQRAPRVLISFQPATLGGKDWTKSIEREDATILAAIEQAGTEAGTQVDEFPEGVSRWIRVSAPTSLTDGTTDDAEGMADALAHRHVRAFGAGRMVWGFTVRIPHPHLEIGDAVAVQLTKFVGRDPIQGREIRGPAWVRGVIVGRNLWGTKFLIWVRALTDITTSPRYVSQRGTFEPQVQVVVEEVDQRPDQAKVRIRAVPDNTSEVTIRYAILSAAAALPERSTDPAVWTTYTGPVTITRDVQNVQRLVAWADWLGAWGPRHVAEIAPDHRPQVMTLTLAGAHVDVAHQDVAHQDVAHGDAAHTDTHTDTAHTDIAHGDQAELFWADEMGQADCFALSGVTVCQPHEDEAHQDAAHVDTHGDVAHTDNAHSDAHTDATHGDGNYGNGVAVQADGDTGSIKVVARKTGNPTAADVRTQPAVDGRNVTTTLIDAATGASLILAPGDTAFIGALAYSRAAAAGIEGPLALARISLFTVAPVGTDLWVPA